MPRDPSHVFLSGSTGDFQQVRQDLDVALRRGLCKVTHQDSFPQTASDTLLKLAQLVAPCGIMIHMIGENPGSIPTPEIRGQYLALADADGKFLSSRPALRAALGDFSTVTYTQWEAYIALHLEMPLLVYADGSHASPTHPQRAHLDRLKGIVRYPSSFDDHSALNRMVMADLMAHFLLNPATSGIPTILKPFNLPGGYIGQLFLGRDEFLETIHQSLQGGGHATAITQKHAATGISGLGGIGKTHAAVEYANRHRDEYTALLFASGDTPEKLQSSLANLCSVLRLDENGGLPPEESVRVRATLDWLATHPGWLLIIDNVDDEPAALALTEILGQLTAGHVLITSRLHGWSSQVKNIDLEVLSEASSVDLLLQLTADRRRIAPDDETQARQLAILLEGLPLAIQQAAGFINEQALTIGDYICRYEKEAADLLNWFNDLSIPYERPEKLAPRPVLVTWKTSFDQLTRQDRAIFLVFSHFAPDPIPCFLLESLAGGSSEQKSIILSANTAITHACKYSLIVRSRTEPVFKIHRLVQEITRLQATEEMRQAALVIAFSIIAFAHLGDPSDVRSWPKWDPILPHALAICAHAPDDPAPAFLTLLLGNLGSILHTKSLYSSAEKLYWRALRIDLSVYGDEHPQVAADFNNLASLYLDTNRLVQSEPFMREALRIDLARYGANHPNIALRFNNLAQVLQATNRLAEAELMMRDALRINQEYYGEDHPKIAINLNNLAGLLLVINHVSEAEQRIKEALRIDLAAYGSDHPIVGRDLNNLGQLLHDTNRFVEAEPLMFDALRILKISYGDDHPDVATCLHNLARLFKATNRLDQAELLCRRALRIDRAVFGKNHPKIGIGLNNLSALLLEKNCLVEAELLIREALHIDLVALGSDHPNVAYRLNNLADILKITNRSTEAEPLIRESLRILNNSLGTEHPKTMTVSQNLEVLLAEIAAAERDG